jgi:imidazolonepropionase-like amidohydrolase
MSRESPPPVPDDAPSARAFAVVVDDWFDGERRRRETTTFRVVDGCVADIDSGDRGIALAAQGLRVLRGAFLMPGLVDAHVHLFLDGAATDPGTRARHLKEPIEHLLETARRNARRSLACGVTLVRDAGDRHGINHRIRAEAQRASSTLARVRSAGCGIRAPKRYGAFMAAEAGTDDELREAIAQRAADSDEIKLILTGLIDFEAGAVTEEPQFTLAQARLFVETAHACGRRIFAHCSGAKGLGIAIEAGVDCIEHGFFMTPEVCGQMARRAIAWTPTFGPVHFQWANAPALGWPAETVDKLRRMLDEHARHLKLAVDAGVAVLLGTDAGSMGVAHGDAVFDEIDRYGQAGLSLEQILAAATSNPRRHFGFEHARLSRRAPFDAVLLERSPFDDRSALRRPLRVWRPQWPPQRESSCATSD